MEFDSHKCVYEIISMGISMAMSMSMGISMAKKGNFNKTIMK
jgi:hypothetical protein